MTQELRLAFLGCGAISKFHLLGIRDAATQIKVTAAIDVDASRAQAVAAETGARAFSSFDEALAWGGFDAVDLMLPHDLHEKFAVQSFEAGHHLLLEKPMAPDLAACDRILEAARKAGTVFMVAENAQYWPEVVQVRELLEAGAIGEPETARGNFFVPPLPDYYGGERAWRLNQSLAGGGIAIDTGSHWLRPLRIWMGEIDEVVAGLGRPLDRMEGESLVRALLRFRSGKLGVFDGMLTTAARGPEPLFRVTGSEGEITVEGLGDVMLYDANHRRGTQIGERGGYMKSYAGEFADFARAVTEGTTPAAGPEESLGELRAALAMYRSAETGSWQKVWE
ncbi:MAG: Gfo/Idh/MocA family oxidoreductase [Myxococcota bacterium]|nr:Gfo/Idh/MocA family oxidoreductase [Myxococcota bacterium]